MKRRQIRAMIRSEAVILALFGAVIGIVVGTGMGAALSRSLEKSQEIPSSRSPSPAWSSSLSSPPSSGWPQRVGQHGGRPSSMFLRPSLRNPSTRSGACHGRLLAERTCFSWGPDIARTVRNSALWTPSDRELRKTGPGPKVGGQAHTRKRLDLGIGWAAFSIYSKQSAYTAARVRRK